MTDVCVKPLRRKEVVSSSIAAQDITHVVFIEYYLQMLQDSAMTAIKEQHQAIFMKLAISGQLDDCLILYFMRQSGLAINDSLLTIVTKSLKSKIVASKSLKCLVEASLGIHILSSSISTDPVLSVIKIMVGLLQDRLLQKEAAVKPVLKDLSSRMAQVFSIEAFKLNEVDIDLSSIDWLHKSWFTKPAVTIDVLFRSAVLHIQQHCSNDSSHTIQTIDQISLNLYNIVYNSSKNDSNMDELCGSLSDAIVAAQRLSNCSCSLSDAIEVLSLVILQLAFLTHFLRYGSNGSETQARHSILWKYASFLADKLVFLRTAVEWDSVYQCCQVLLRSTVGKLGTIATTATDMHLPEQVESTECSALWSAAGKVLCTLVEAEQMGQISHWGALLHDTYTQQSQANNTAAIHPGLLTSAVQSLLGDRTAHLRATWQCKNGVQTAGCCLLPQLALSTAMRTAIEHDMLGIDMNCQGCRINSFPSILQCFESIRQSWWTADPGGAFQLFFDTCCQVLHWKVKTTCIEKACVADIASVLARCLVFVSRLLRLAPSNALSFATLRDPADWTLPSPLTPAAAQAATLVRDGSQTLSLDCELESEGAKRCKEEEALLQRALGVPHSFLRSALFLECMRNILQQKHFDELSQWLGTAQKASLAETALLLRDLGYLLRPYTSYSVSYGTAQQQTVVALVSSMRSRKSSNHPSARLWQSIISEAINSLTRLPIATTRSSAEGGLPEFQTQAPPTEKTAFWKAVAKLERESYGIAIQRTAEQAVLDLLHTPSSDILDAPHSEWRVSAHVLNSLSTLRTPVVSDRMSLFVALGSTAASYIENNDELFVTLFTPEPHSGNLLHYTSIEQQLCGRPDTSKVRTGPLSAAKLELMLSNFLSSRNLSAVPAVNCVEVTFVLIHAAYSTVKAIDTSIGILPPLLGSDTIRNASVALIVDVCVMEVITAHAHLIIVPVVITALREHLQQLLHYCVGLNSTEVCFNPNSAADSPYWIARRYIATIVEMLLQLQLPPSVLLDAVSSIYDPPTLRALWDLLLYRGGVLVLAVFPVLETLAQSVLKACMADASCLLSNVVVTAPLWALLSAVSVYGLNMLDTGLSQERYENVLKMCTGLASSLLSVSISKTDASIDEKTCSRSLSPLWRSATVSPVEYCIFSSEESVPHSSRLTVSSTHPQPESLCVAATGSIGDARAVCSAARTQCPPPFALSLESLSSLLLGTSEMLAADRGASDGAGDYSAVAPTVQGLRETVHRAVSQGWHSQELSLVRYVASLLAVEESYKIPMKLLQIALHARASCCITSTDSRKEVAVAFLVVLLVHLRQSTTAPHAHGITDIVECSGGIGGNSVLAVLGEHLKALFSIAVATKSSTATTTARCEAAWSMEMIQFVGVGYLVQELQQRQSTEQCAAHFAHVVRIASQLRLPVPAHLRRALLVLAGCWLHFYSNPQDGKDKDGEANHVPVPKHALVILKFLLQTCATPKCRLEEDLQTACFSYLKDITSVMRSWRAVLEKTAALREARSLRMQELSSHEVPQRDAESTSGAGASISRSASVGLLNSLPQTSPSSSDAPLMAIPRPAAAARPLERSGSSTSLANTPPTSKRQRNADDAARISEKKPSIVALSEKARKKQRSSNTRSSKASSESKSLVKMEVPSHSSPRNVTSTVDFSHRSTTSDLPTAETVHRGSDQQTTAAVAPSWDRTAEESNLKTPRVSSVMEIAEDRKPISAAEGPPGEVSASLHRTIPVAVAPTPAADTPAFSNASFALSSKTQHALPLQAARRASQTRTPVVSKKFSDSF